MMVRKVDILDPTAELEEEETGLVLSVPELRGKVIGFLDNGWWSINVVFTRLERLLKERSQPAGIVWRVFHEKSKAAPDAVIEELVQKCDVVISGLGN